MKLRNRLRQTVLCPKREPSAIDFSLGTARALLLNDANTTKDQPSLNDSDINVKEGFNNEKFIKKLKNNPNMNIHNLEKADSTDIKVESTASTSVETSVYIPPGI